MTGPRLAADVPTVIAQFGHYRDGQIGHLVTMFVPYPCGLFAGVRTDAGVEVRGLEPLYGTTDMQVERSTGLDGSLALRLVDAPVPADETTTTGRSTRDRQALTRVVEREAADTQEADRG